MEDIVKVGHRIPVSAERLVLEYGPGTPDPDCLPCDIAQVQRICERGTRQREVREHMEVLASAQVDAAAYARLVQEMRAGVEEGLPPRACFFHLIPAQRGGGG